LQARRIAVPEYSVTAVDGEAHAQNLHDRMPDSRARHRRRRQWNDRRGAEQAAAARAYAMAVAAHGGGGG
jgi:ribonuclease-3